MTGHITAFSPLIEIAEEDQIEEVESYLRDKGATFPEATTAPSTLDRLLRIVDVSHVIFEDAKLPQNEVEGFFFSVVSFFHLLELEQKQPVVDKMCTKVMAGATTENGPFKLRILKANFDQTGGSVIVQVGGCEMVQVGGCEMVQVGGSEMVQVGGCEMVQVGWQWGGSEMVQVGGCEMVQVGGCEMVQVGGCEMVRVGGCEMVQVGGREMVQVGGCEMVQVGGREMVQVGGCEMVQVGGCEMVQVGGCEMVQVGGCEMVQVGGCEMVQVGGSVIVQATYHPLELWGGAGVEERDAASGKEFRPLQLKRWVDGWSLSQSDKRALYKLLWEAYEHVNLQLATKFLVELLKTYSASSAQEEEEPQRLVEHAIVLAIADGRQLVFDDLLTLPVVKAVQSKKIYQLFDIFVRERLSAFEKFYKENKSFVDDLGLKYDECVRKMRLLTLASLAEECRDIPFATLTAELNLPAEELEMFVVEAIGMRLIEARVNQVMQRVVITKSVYRTLTTDHWKLLHKRLSVWKQNIHAVKSSLNNFKSVQ
eukprot:Em0003g753a